MSIMGYTLKIMRSSDHISFDGTETVDDESIVKLHDWADVENILSKRAPEYVPYPHASVGTFSNEDMTAWRTYNDEQNRYVGIRRAVSAALNSFPLSGDRHIVWAGANGDKDYGFYVVVERCVSTTA